jgi:dihydropteroate synthase
LALENQLPPKARVVNEQKLILKRLGVINVTPNSFSDGAETQSPEAVRARVRSFGPIEALDIGGESTAPMADALHPEEEWQRLLPHLPLLRSLKLPISIDTYHPETIGRIARIWITEKITTPLIWNDVSGKLDQAVEAFLEMRNNFYYVYCHNLAPIRQLTGKHMDYLSESEGDEFINEMARFFMPAVHPRVILDPCLGFSKSYEQNWTLLDRFDELQKKIGHDQWLLGFSRKSFLRKRLGINDMTDQHKEQLDQFHGDILKTMRPKMRGTVWIRTHRPELVSTL